MASKSKQYLEYCIGILLTLGIGYHFYSLCSIFPICSDDYAYSFSWATQERISSLTDIWQSSACMYMKWTGRVLVHSLAHTFLAIDKIWYNLANTVCYLFTCFLISRIARPYTLRAFVLIASVLWFALPSPGCTLLWLTGSCNYLWASMLNILVLVLLLNSNPKIQWLSVPVALCAGNSHEGISICMFVSLTAYIILNWRQKREVVYVCTLIFLGIGIASNVLAPGTFVRMASTHEADSGSAISNLISNYIQIGVSAIRGQREFNICFCLFPMVLLLNLYSYVQKRIISKLSIALLLGAILGTFIPMAANTLYARAFFGPSLFLFLSCTVVTVPLVANITSSAYAIVAYISIACNMNIIYTARHAVRHYRNIEEYAADKMKQGDHIIILPALVKNGEGGRFIEPYGYFPVHTGNMSRAAYNHTKDIAFFFESDETTKIIKHIDEILPDFDFEYIVYGDWYIFQSHEAVKAIKAMESENSKDGVAIPFSSFIHNNKTYILLPRKQHIKLVLQYTNGGQGVFDLQ